MSININGNGTISGVGTFNNSTFEAANGENLVLRADTDNLVGDTEIILELDGAKRVHFDSSKLYSNGDIYLGTETDLGSSSDIQISSSTGGSISFARTDTAAVADERLGDLRFFTNAPDGVYNPVGVISCFTLATPEAGDKPTYVTVSTASTNTVLAEERIRISEAGLTLPTANYSAVPAFQSGTIVPEIGRSSGGSDYIAVSGVYQNPVRRNGRWSRVGDLVTYSFDWKGTMDWGQIQNQPWRDDELIFTAPYAATSDEFIQSNGVYRAWQTKIPHGDDTFCNGVISVASGNAIIGFQEIFNNGGQATGASWELWRQSQTGGGDNFEVQVTLTYFTDDTTWQPVNGATISS